MSKEYKKVSVFIDTNILQSFISHNRKNYVFLANLGITKKYYDLVAFIIDNQLQNYIEICIPEVVFRELRQHMIDNFNDYCENVVSDSDYFSKIGGDLVEFNCRIKISKEDYPQYVDSLINDFINNRKNICKHILMPSKAVLLDVLLDKSLRGEKPFVNHKTDGKLYTDAGFRDSIIAETIYSHCAVDDKKCLFITNDSDFGKIFESTLNESNKYVRCSSIEQAIEFLKKYYETSAKDKLKREFTENTYWHEYLLNDIGEDYDESVTNVSVESIQLVDDDQYNIYITIIVNEAEYRFTVHFDSVANDIIDIQYEIEND